MEYMLLWHYNTAWYYIEYFTHREYPPWIHHWMLTDASPILHGSMQTYTAKTLGLL